MGNRLLEEKEWPHNQEESKSLKVSKTKRVLEAGSTEDLFLALRFALAPPHATSSNIPLGLSQFYH